MAGLFGGLHATYLDFDLPPWQVTFYQPIDELFYTIPAFNIFHFSQFAYSPLPGEVPEGSPANLLQNLLTLLTLCLFGNNYFGLRMASVLAGFISLLLLCKASASALKKTFKETGSGNKIFCSVAIVFIIFSFDFSFNIGSRVAEPTIFSILYTSVLIYVMSRMETLDRRSAAAIGMLAGGAPFFGYLYLLFLVPASGIALFVYATRSGLAKALNCSAWFVVGACLSVLSYFLLLAFLLEGEVGRYFLWIFQSGGERVAGTPLTLAALKGYVYDFLAGNIFRFNPALLLLSIFSFFTFLIYKKKNYPLVYLFVLGGAGFRFLQFLVLSDHYHRKLLDISPFLFMILVFGVHFLASHSVKMRGVFQIKLVIPVLLAVLVSWLVISEHNVFKYFSTHALNIYGGEEIQLGASKAILLLASLGLTATALLLAFSRISLISGKIMSAFLIAGCTIPGIIFSYMFIFERPEFKYRNAQIKLSSLVDGKILIGNYSHAFRLYNKSIPYFNVYTFMGSQEALNQRTRNLLAHEKAWGSIGDMGIAKSQWTVSGKDQSEQRLTESDFIDIGDVENKKKRYILLHK